MQSRVLALGHVLAGIRTERFAVTSEMTFVSKAFVSKGFLLWNKCCIVRLHIGTWNFAWLKNDVINALKTRLVGQKLIDRDHRMINIGSIFHD